jgi:hypothetical protein
MCAGDECSSAHDINLMSNVNENIKIKLEK